MPVDNLEIRVSITKVLIALVIVIVPLSVIGLVLTQQSDRSLDNSVGTNFKTIAQLYSDGVTQFMRDRVADVSALATDPAIESAVAAARKNGNSSAAADLNSGPLNSPASQVLRQRKAVDPRFLSLVVTDDSGRVIAASQKPAKTSYAQDADWQSAYNNGNGSPKVSDIIDDTFSKAYYVTVAVPVSDVSSGTTVGVVSAAVNVSDLLSRFRQDEIGTGARAALVSDDGIIVSAPNADVFARVKSPEFDYVRDSLGSSQGRQTGWVMADLKNGHQIVGFAGTGLKQHFANLGWFVTVSQAEHEAAAPIRQLEHFALLMVILGVLMLTLLCVYWYLHRVQRYPHLEEPADEAPRTSAASAASGARGW